MGREIRRVPPNWKHPEYEDCPHLNGLDWTHKRHNSPSDYQYGKCFQPLCDVDFDTALQEWLAEYESWKQSGHPYQEDYEHFKAPPDPEYYRPAWTVDEAISFQIYETVSEGTPISPVFATKDAMRQWLITQGYSEFATDKFIEDSWAPSMMGIAGVGLLPEIHSLDYLDPAKK
ncbi:hypothetical protein KA005_38135 [bacterium]|nr:hypothetical protein [bacterium]